jgi:hypothetical protein
LTGKTKGSSPPAQVVINFEQTAAAVKKLEEQLSRRIGLPPAIQQIEDDANRVLAEEINPASECGRPEPASA